MKPLFAIIIDQIHDQQSKIEIEIQCLPVLMFQLTFYIEKLKLFLYPAFNREIQNVNEVIIVGHIVAHVSQCCATSSKVNGHTHKSEIANSVREMNHDPRRRANIIALTRNATGSNQTNVRLYLFF